MVALEIFVMSSLYTAGNAVKYFLERWALRKGETLGDGTQATTLLETPEKFVELSVQYSETHAPFYVGTGSGHVGVGIPVGGGTTTELKEVLSAVVGEKENLYTTYITDLNTRERCAVPHKYWLNTPDDLKTFFDQHRIPQNIIPLSLPLQVRELKIPPKQPIYRVNSILGSSQKAVLDAAVYYRSFGRHPGLSTAAAFGVLMTGTYLYSNWNDWDQQERRRRYLRAVGLG